MRCNTGLSRKAIRCMVYGVWSIFTAAVFIGCKSVETLHAPAVQVPIQYREKVVERLVAVQSPADSANIEALFECDSLNRVIMKTLNEQKSNNVSSRVTFAAGVMRYKLETRPDISYIPVKDSIVYREVAVQVPVEVKINVLTWWQQLWITVGKVAFGLIGLLIGYTVLKARVNIYGILGKLIINLFSKKA